VKNILSRFDPLPVQREFLLSKAKVRGYGGAMGGGKSRTGCEQIFDYALDYPGIVCLIARQAHTSIVETTKKTMLGQVVDPLLYSPGYGRSRASGGEDYIQLWNGSRIHFTGLDDPLRWYSSEIGCVFFDECQEIEEDTVLRIITRLRQPGMPNCAILTFNPSDPGHWLKRWFIDEGQRTKYGFKKGELWMEGATSSIGHAEFFFAKAADNPHLPDGYVDETLAGMKEWMRRRYLEGLWEFISGNAFFDVDSLREYEHEARAVVPLANGTTAGDIGKDIAYRTQGGPKLAGPDRLRIVPGEGKWTIFKSPVRRKWDEQAGKATPGHRYVVAVDAASGRGRDYSAIQVIDVEAFEQVAEWQGKLETGLVADEAYRIARIYADALIVPEVTGGWGLAIDQVLKRYRYPKLYTRRTWDRLSSQWTDRTGYDTTTRTRMVILDNLETVIREHEFVINSLRTVAELGSFVYSERDKPEAQPGCNDDLVLALAIGMKVVTDLPKEVVEAKERPYVPQFTATGY
jgi:hypothetical protein